jgi:hypothetical protein
MDLDHYMSPKNLSQLGDRVGHSPKAIAVDRIKDFDQITDFDERDTVNFVDRTPETLVAGKKNARKKIRTNKKSLELGRRPLVNFSQF